MAIQGRYQFVKKVYPNYLVIIVSNKNKRGYTSCGIDKSILENIEKKKSKLSILKKLEEMNINYIVLDGLTITKKYESSKNSYDRLFYLEANRKVLLFVGKYLKVAECEFLQCQ